MSDRHIHHPEVAERRIIARAVCNGDAWPETRLFRPCDFSSQSRYILWQAIQFSYGELGRFEWPLAERFLRDHHADFADELLETLGNIVADSYLADTEGGEQHV